MKIALFETRSGERSLGIVEGSEIVDLGHWLGPVGASPLAAFLQRSQEERPPLDGERIEISTVTLLPTAFGAEAIVCVGVNYAEHGRRVAEKYGVEFDPSAPPSLFLKVWSSLVGHDQPIIRPAQSEWLDFEGELAVIIGEHCRNVPRDEALNVVAGYSIGNDGSIRDWQRNLPTPTAGKNFYRTGSLGPWMVTADEIGDPSALHITTTLNGEVMQDAPLADLMNDIPALIEHITSFMPLAPGDVIFTGTPGGSFSDRGNERWLVPGDEVEINISKIGTLRNQVVAE